MRDRNTVYPITFVYELIDPRDGKPFYVGITNNPKMRLYQHTTRSFKSRGGHFSLSQRRIQEIRNAGHNPTMNILEQLENVTWREAENCEMYWMHYRWYIDGIHLTNIRSGNSEIRDEYIRKHR